METAAGFPLGKPSGYHILVPLELSYFRLLQHRAVGKGDCISVEIDRAVIRKAGYCAVPGQIPGAAALNSDYRISGYIDPYLISSQSACAVSTSDFEFRYHGLIVSSSYVGDVKPEDVKAKYESGVLTIHFNNYIC